MRLSHSSLCHKQFKDYIATLQTTQPGKNSSFERKSTQLLFWWRCINTIELHSTKQCIAFKLLTYTLMGYITLLLHVYTRTLLSYERRKINFLKVKPSCKAWADQELHHLLNSKIAKVSLMEYKDCQTK